MRSKIIEEIIESVIDQSDHPQAFKSAFKQYVKNKFDNNASESDLKRILTLLSDPTEDYANENVNS